MSKLSISFIVCLLLSLGCASAQVSIESAMPRPEPTFDDSVKTDDSQPEYSNEAKLRAERAARRKERNFFEFNIGINGSLSNFNSKWQAANGNSNSITGMYNMLVNHSFKKGRFTLDNKVTAKLGATNQERTWTKSQDEWFISTAPAYRFSDNWSLGAIISLRSQFANGVDDTNSRTSCFFAPAYFNISLGFNYVCPKEKFPVKINLSPLSMNTTYVESGTVRAVFFAKKGFTDADGNAVTYDRFLAERDTPAMSTVDVNTPYCYGLTLRDGTSRYEGGSSIQIDFDRTFGKKEIFRYRTTFYTFYGWINEITQQTDRSGATFAHILPTIRWEHTVDIKATKYFSTQFYFQMYYNKAQINSLQTQIVLGVGLSYTFKNK